MMKITIIYVNCVMTAQGVHNSRAILLMMMMSGAVLLEEPLLSIGLLVVVGLV